MTYFNTALRASVRQQLILTGVPAAFADEIVDLAIHAAESARVTAVDICNRGSTEPVKMAALGPAFSLIKVICEEQLEHLDQVAHATPGMIVRHAKVHG